MQTVVRRYSGKGAKELFDVLEQRTADVEEVMRSVKGFVGYTLVRTSEGGFSVTVCHLTDALTELWDAPVDTPALRWGR